MHDGDRVAGAKATSSRCRAAAAGRSPGQRTTARKRRASSSSRRARDPRRGGVRVGQASQHDRRRRPPSSSERAMRSSTAGRSQRLRSTRPRCGAAPGPPAVLARADDGARSAPSGSTGRRSGRTERCTAPSAGGRCGSRRRTAASSVDPLDAETEPVVRKLLGFDFDLVAFSAWAAGRRTLAPLVVRFAGFRPSLAPDPFEMLRRRRSPRSRSRSSRRRDPQPARRAARRASRPRLGVPDARAGRGGVGGGALRARLLPAQGGVRRRARPRSELDLAALALLPDEEVQGRRSSRSAASASGRRTGSSPATSAGRAPWPAGDLALRKAVRALYGDVDVRATGARFEPFQNLTAHYLLAQYLMPDIGSVIRPATRGRLCRSCSELWRGVQRARFRTSRGATDDDDRVLEHDRRPARGRRRDRRARPKGRAASASSRSLYVRPKARGRGLGAELIREAVEHVREPGAEMLELEVLESNAEARADLRRAGAFEAGRADARRAGRKLEQRLAPADGPTFGFVHVQTDDAEKVTRDAAKVLRLEPEVEVDERLGARALRRDRRGSGEARRRSRRSSRTRRRRRPLARRRARRRRALRPLRSRRRRSTSTCPCPSTSATLPPGRRLRARGERDGRRAADRRRSEARARGGADGGLARRAAAGAGAVRADRRRCMGVQP